MTIKEILAVEIPEGEHSRSLEMLKGELEYRISKQHLSYVDVNENDKWKDSLCASFTALYELDTGEFCNKGYSKAIDDVLGVVKEFEKKRWTTKPVPTTIDLYKEIQALKEVK